MPNNGNNNNTLLNTLEELFTESVSLQLLRSPMLWEQHTFSKSTINRLAVFSSKQNNRYITHPCTRNNICVDKIKELPENFIIQDLILIFLYCKSIEIDNKTLRNIFIYFINILLVQQKKLNRTNHLLNSSNHIQDVLLRNLGEALKCTKQIIKILTIPFCKNVISGYKVIRPLDIHLNGILFMAIKYNNDRLIDLMLSLKLEIDVSIVDKKNKTLLHWACYYGKKELVTKLINFNANLNAQDVDRRSPLYWACYNNKYEVAKVLLQNNADVDFKDINGKTPILIARNKGHIKLAEMLIEYGSTGGYTIKNRSNNTLMVWFYEKTSQLDNKEKVPTKENFKFTAAKHTYKRSKINLS